MTFRDWQREPRQPRCVAEQPPAWQSPPVPARPIPAPNRRMTGKNGTKGVHAWTGEEVTVGCQKDPQRSLHFVSKAAGNRCPAPVAGKSSGHDAASRTGTRAIISLDQTEGGGMVDRREFLSAAVASAVTLARNPMAFAAQASKYDLLITGGRVIDPSVRLDAVRDVAIAGGRIAAVEPGITT